jgi:hypothetical protein
MGAPKWLAPAVGGTDGLNPDRYHSNPLTGGGGYGYSRWGYGGGIGIGGVLLIVLIVYLLVGRGRF